METSIDRNMPIKKKKCALMGLNKHLSALPASLRIAHGKQSIKKGIIYRSPAGRIYPSWFSTEIAMLYLHGN